MATIKTVSLKDLVEVGKMEPHHFATTSVAAPTEAPAGGVLLKMLAVSVDPYMRNRMRPSKSYFPSFVPGEPISSHAVARVVASNREGLTVGDLVAALMPWSETFAVSAEASAGLKKISNPHNLPSQHYCGAMGMPGFTAYYSLKTLAEPIAAGETAFVSGAAGAVGMIVGQLLKNVYGCRVVGSAGSDDKVEYLTKELGFDAAFNYKTSTVKDGLAAHCPKGINIYFDNVGGETLEAALEACLPFARIVMCGAISQYDSSYGTHFGPRNLFLCITKQLRMLGFMAGTGLGKPEAVADFEANMGDYIASGKVKVVEHVTKGIEHAGEAFSEMMAGLNLGKAVVVLE